MNISFRGMGAALGAQAQGVKSLAGGQRQIVVDGSLIVVIYLVSTFVLKAIKSLHDYRLKNKLIEKDLPQEIFGQFLQPEKNEAGHQSIKIFFVLACAGIGLSAIAFFNPSLVAIFAIMSFSIAGSFLAYFIYLKRSV